MEEGVLTVMMSQSVNIKAFLVEQGPSYAFTAKDLYHVIRMKFPSVTEGAISGLLHKAVVAGYFMTEAHPTQRGKIYKRTMLDLVGMPISDRSTGGSFKGRKVHHRGPIITTLSKDDIRDKLLDLAAMVESIRPSLDQYTTRELLAELARREEVSYAASK